MTTFSAQAAILLPFTLVMLVAALSRGGGMQGLVAGSYPVRRPSQSRRAEVRSNRKTPRGEASSRHCGPFPDGRARVLVLTVGNDVEEHGPALPLDVDSRTVLAMAVRFTETTGATFAAHVPYTSDRVGDLALDWSPAFIPYDEFKEKLIAYCGAIVRAWPEEPERVVLLIGHGGLLPLMSEIEEVEAGLGVRTEAHFPPAMGAAFLALPEGFEANDTLREIVGGKGEHAYIMEHSIAAHFGFLDREKLAELNRLAGEDPEAVLRRWPVLAGLGGFVKFGDERYDPLRELVDDFCSDDFIARRQLPVSANAGAAVVEAALKELRQRVFHAPGEEP